MIRSKDAEMSSPKKSARFEEGNKVEGNYRGRGKWYPGKITSYKQKAAYDISYDDGESETRVEKELIRSKEADVKKSSRLEEGSKVEGNYKGRGKWYPGKITRDRVDRTSDTSYDDGDSETRVVKEMNRSKDGVRPSPM